MRRRLVRVHLMHDLPSLEGLLVSYRTQRQGGHYIIELAKVIESPDDTVTLTGDRVRVPRERVAFVQELST